MYETNRQSEERARRGNGQDGRQSDGQHIEAAPAAETEERIRSEARDRAAQARRLIRSNPFATAGIAFAAGVVLSALLRR